jgi:uncharacterized membrane protein YGL010W
MAKSIQTWLDEYGESHQNKVNKRIHWFCVPQIVWTIMAFIFVIPSPATFTEISPHLNWLTLSSLVAVVFYLRLSFSITIGMVVFFALCYYSLILFETALPGYLLMFAVIYFVVLWALQFYGHEVEGKKPSFLKDVQFLMIGPIWLMSFIFQKVGLKY